MEKRVSDNQGSSLPEWLGGASEFAARVLRFYERAGEFAARISRFHKRVGAAYVAFARNSAELLALLAQIPNILPQMTSDLVAPFVENLWYPDLAMPFSDMAALSDLFAVDPQAAEQQFLSYLEDSMIEIRSRLVVEWPDRADALVEALKAHEEGMYYSSIPVFLAQADGMVVARFGRQLYSHRHRKHLEKYLARVSAEPYDSALAEALVCPMIADSDLNKPRGARSSNSEELNRHAVLHGHDSKYGTRENSGRALSHLLFVAGCIGMLRDKTPST